MDGPAFPLPREGALTPAALAEYLSTVEQPLDFDVVVGIAGRDRRIPAREFADAGTTWLVTSAVPEHPPALAFGRGLASVGRGPDRSRRLTSA